LLPTVFKQLSRYAEFKAFFHCVYIQVLKDPDQKWYGLSYLAMDDAIAEVLKKWPANLHTPSDLATGTSMSMKK